MACNLSHLTPSTDSLSIASTKTVANIDAKVVGDTTVFTTAPSFGRFYPVLVRIVLSAVSGLVTAPTVSVGTNSPNFNNIMGATPMTTLTAANDFFAFLLSSVAPSVAASTAIKCRVSAGATATTYTIAAHVIG